MRRRRFTVASLAFMALTACAHGGTLVDPQGLPETVTLSVKALKPESQPLEWKAFNVAKAQLVYAGREVEPDSSTILEIELGTLSHAMGQTGMQVCQSYVGRWLQPARRTRSADVEVNRCRLVPGDDAITPTHTVVDMIVKNESALSSELLAKGVMELTSKLVARAERRVP